ncbi:gliding motility-associated C-terminal domain-containing protein, partial [Algibacter sp. 2305UL17-15]|uniref:gliding motility-associated C-terminal domain-containing protein n=1 Tax=Algibacter sp. 2305UL17-15 TaxID=3231268 RepID=UPI003458CC09
TFTIEDTTNPTWTNTPADMTVECDGTADPSGAFAAWLASFSGTDTCGSAAVTTNSTGLSDLCGATGTETVTFTLTDECGNAITADATFTIEDTTNPTWINAPADLTVECDGTTDANGALTLWLNSFTGTDTCSTATVTNNSNTLSNLCGANGSEMVTFTLTDECGNAITADATFTIQDTTDPTWVNAPTDMTVECDGTADPNGAFATWLTSFSGTDACGNTTVTTNTAGLSDLCGATGSETVTFTLTDECGNDITMDATFTIQDTTDPTWINEPMDMTVECDGTADPNGAFAAWLVSFSGTDACGTATVTSNSTGLSDLCGATGTETVTFTLTDECGNDISKDVTFTIQDTTNPTWTNTPTDMTVECDGTTDPSGAFANWLTSFSGTDTCSTATVTNNSSGLSNICGATASETVTFTLTDECGNLITKDATFGIIDTTAPTWTNVPVDMTVECDGTIDPSGAFAAWLTSFSGTDTCGTAAVTTNSAGLSDLCGATGTETVTFTLKDECGNAIEVDATFTIEDTTLPTFDGRLPGDITVECDAIPVAENITASDNCSDANVTVTDVTTPGACEGSYKIERTYTATDECGLFVAYAQNITVVDTTAPTPSTDFERELTVSCTDIPDAPSVTFTDNCSSDANITVVFNEVNGFDDTMFNDYQIIRTWTVRDACTNEAVYTQTLNVKLDEIITQVTGPDKCHNDGIIDLNDFLTSDNKEGTWELIEGDDMAELNGNLFNPTTLEPSENFKPGTDDIDYLFRYTGLDNGCINITEVSMAIIPDCIVLPCGDTDVVISKAVTPNGDGINDSFDIMGIELCGFTANVKIFNRWGALIYESSAYTLGEGQGPWQGTSHKSSVGSAGKVPNGTYYYIITLENSGLAPYTGPIYIGTK